MKILTEKKPTQEELQEYCTYLDKVDFGYEGTLNTLGHKEFPPAQFSL